MPDEYVLGAFRTALPSLCYSGTGIAIYTFVVALRIAQP